MIRGNLFHRRRTIAIITFACSLVIWNGSADSALAAGGKTHSMTPRRNAPRPFRPHCGTPKPLLTEIA